VAHPDRDVDQLRKRFLEGLQMGMSPGTLRKFVIGGTRPDERTGSGRRRTRG
jgi:hypothetical protein